MEPGRCGMSQSGLFVFVAAFFWLLRCAFLNVLWVKCELHHTLQLNFYENIALGVRLACCVILNQERTTGPEYHLMLALRIVVNGLSAIAALRAAWAWFHAAHSERELGPQMYWNGRAAAWASVTAVLQAVCYGLYMLT
jgi:hypothetical protein